MQSISGRYCRQGAGVKCLKDRKLFCHTTSWNTSYRLPNKIIHNTICLHGETTHWRSRGCTFDVEKEKKERQVHKVMEKSQKGVRKEGRDGEKTTAILRATSELRNRSVAKAPGAPDGTDMAMITPIIPPVAHIWPSKRPPTPVSSHRRLPTLAHGLALYLIANFTIDLESSLWAQGDYEAGEEKVGQIHRQKQQNKEAKNDSGSSGKIVTWKN